MSNDDRSTVDDWVHLPPTELVVSVPVAPAPEIALALLRPALTPVRDNDGELVDWSFDPLTVFESDPDDDADLIGSYRAWRSTWCRAWPIGPITNVASFATEVAAVEHDLGRHLDEFLARIVVAGGADVSISPELAQPTLRELETVRLALSVDHRSGVGLIDDMPTRTRSSGLARAWVAPAHEMVLAATPTTSVVIHPHDGLVIVHGDPESASTFAGVTAVDMRGDTVLILNDRGSSLRMTQTDARPLGWIVPRSLRWHLRPVPLVAVWSPLLEGLAAALRLSVERGVAVHVDGPSTMHGTQRGNHHGARPGTDFPDG